MASICYGVSEIRSKYWLDLLLEKITVNIIWLLTKYCKQRLSDFLRLLDRVIQYC
jgi:hypothetical protein